VQLGEGHLRMLRELIAPLGTGGNLASDAHLAALALEHGAELCSCNSNFSRFPGLQWRNPLADVRPTRTGPGGRSGRPRSG